MAINQVGKQGKINATANQILNQKYAEAGANNSCEIGRAFDTVTLFAKCTKVWQGYAHRHKRLWYKNQPHLLAYYTQTIRACNYCHNKIEGSAKLTQLVFSILRPDNMKEPNTKITKGQKEKLTSKKAAWAQSHPCKNCKQVIGSLLCPHCGKLSV